MDYSKEGIEHHASDCGGQAGATPFGAVLVKRALLRRCSSASIYSAGRYSGKANVIFYRSLLENYVRSRTKLKLADEQRGAIQ